MKNEYDAILLINKELQINIFEVLYYCIYFTSPIKFVYLIITSFYHQFTSSQIYYNNPTHIIQPIINSFMSNNKRAILLAISLCLQIYKLIKLKRAISSQAKLIDILKGLDLLCIQDLKSKLINGVYKLGDMVLCHGGLKSSQKISSLLSSETPVAYSELILDKMFQLADRTNTVRRKIRRLHPSYLTLESFGDSINIYETLNTKIIPIMYRKKISTYNQKIINFGWFLKLFIVGPTRRVSSIYTQSYIPDNYYNVVLGKISKTKNGQFFIKNPTAIAPAKQVMISKFLNKMGNDWIVFYCLLALTITTFCIVLKYSLKTSWIRNLFGDITPRKIFDKWQKIIVRSRTCGNCQQKMSSNIRVPCGHLNLCNECEQKSAKQQNSKNCQQCNKKVKDSISIYPC